MTKDWRAYQCEKSGCERESGERRFCPEHDRWEDLLATDEFAHLVEFHKAREAAQDEIRQYAEWQRSEGERVTRLSNAWRDRSQGGGWRAAKAPRKEDEPIELVDVGSGVWEKK